MEKTASELLPYSLSPLCERGRLERCLAFSARAEQPPPDQDRPGDLPSFIVLPRLPVPDFPGRALFHHDNAAFRAVVALIDGQRGVRDIATALAALTEAGLATLEDTVRHCLLQVHPACQGYSSAARQG